MIQKYLGSIVLLCVGISLITSFLITDITSLNSGLGIDGMWYNKTIAQEDYAPSDYHIFKSLPSYLIKVISKQRNNEIVNDYVPKKNLMQKELGQISFYLGGFFLVSALPISALFFFIEIVVI